MITLYQFNACPFCWKVKALLNYAKQSYETVEVSPFGMKEIDFIEHKKVPVLRDGEEIIVESANIVKHVNDKYSQLPMRHDAEQWVKWVDDELVHYLPPLIHPTIKVSYANFSHILDTTDMGWLKAAFTRIAGSLVMPKVARKMQAKHNIEHPEKEFKQAIDKWVTEGLQSKPFFGGEKADFVDCSVFGILHSSHQLGITELASKHNAEFAKWYAQCQLLMSKKPEQLAK
jgi:microsomal prostaglandin-E synthase 2